MGKIFFVCLLVIALAFSMKIKPEVIEQRKSSKYKENLINIRKDLNRKANRKVVRYDGRTGIPSKSGIPAVGKALPINISANDMYCEKGVCIIAIVLEGGKGGRVHFSEFNLKKGERVIVRSPGGDVIYEYRGKGPHRRGDFWSGVVPYDTLYIEYYFKGRNPKGSFKIDKVTYLWDFPFRKRQPPDPIGNPPCDAKDAVCCSADVCFDKFMDAVALYLFLGRDGFEYLCTGTLVSNLSANHDPLFLTANHCIGTQQEAETAVFWFNYYNSSCNPTNPDAQRMAVYVPYATLLDTYADGDASLLRIDGSLRIDLTSYFLAGVLFNGNIMIGGSVFGYSHPLGNPLIYHAGVIENICESDFLIPRPVRCDGSGNSFLVRWDDGGTHGGSSGSCLFYRLGSEWYCIGTLSFGERPTAQCPPLRDYFADISVFYNTRSAVREYFSYGLGDDTYEENDTLQNPALISLNCGDSLNLTGLIVKDMDKDFFLFEAPKGCVIQIDVNFKHIFGDIDIYLYDTSGNRLASSTGIGDGESLNFTFASNEGVILEVDLVDDTFQEYSLTVSSRPKQEPPICSVIINNGAEFTNSPEVNLSITASDSVFSASELEICIYEEGKGCTTWIPFSPNIGFNVSPTDGTKIINVDVRNPLGLQSSCSDSIIFDTTPPSGGTLNASLTDVTTITLSWDGFTDNLSGVSEYVLVYDTSAPPSNCQEGNPLYRGQLNSYVHDGISPGYTYYYRVCAVDGAGNISPGVSSYITVNNEPPVIESFTANPTEGYAPLTVSFSWSVSDREGDKLLCEIDIGNNGLVDFSISDCTPNTFSFTFDNPGTYPVKLIVSDSGGNRSEAIVSINVLEKQDVNKPPYISYFDVFPTQGVAPLEVRIGFSVGDPEGDTLACYIDVDGDGSADYEIQNCTSGNLTHEYEKEGHYTVILTVKDGWGNSASEEMSVTVVDDILTDDTENNIFGCSGSPGGLIYVLIFLSIVFFRRLKLIN